MKIAATYDKESNTIFQHFGKTQNFKVYEIENGKILSAEVIDNGGFGHHDLATYLKNLGVKTVGELIDLKTLGNPDVCIETPIPKDEIIEAVRKLGLSMKCK